VLLLAAAACLVGGSCGHPGTPPPVILIVVDTLRADHLGAYGYPRDTSPEIDAWASSGRLYEQAIATSPWTAPTFGSLFTGTLPARHGVARQLRPDGTSRVGRLDRGLPTLAERLRQAGYATAALVNNPWLGPEWELNRGFGLYDQRGTDNADPPLADGVVDRALAWLDERPEGAFFLVVHLFDPHAPYDAPAPFAGRYSDSIESGMTRRVGLMGEIRSGRFQPDATDREFITATYDEEIAFVDHELGRLRRGLEERRLGEQALIILTSDHGEELFDHGGFEHGHAMWQELLRVPLIVWGPGVVPGREPAAVSLVDVAPTILSFAGMTSDAMSGRSLRANLLRGTPPNPRTLHAEQNLYGTELKAALRWPHKLVVDVVGGGRWLFDLESNPAEQMLPWQERAALADEMLAELTARVAADIELRQDVKAAEPDEETLEQLRSLGYVQ